MRVEVKVGTGDAQSGELLAVGVHLVIQVGDVQTRVYLTDSQWKLLSESAAQRAPRAMQSEGIRWARG